MRSIAHRYIKFLVLLLLAASACRDPEPEPEVTPTEARTLFKALSRSKSGINFTNTPLEKDSLNILYYPYYYNGAGVAVGDINNDGLADIYFAANQAGGNKLYLNKGGLQFEDITGRAGVAGQAEWSTGVTMADVNGDGLLDIYVCAVDNGSTLRGRNILWINKGDLTFADEAEQYGLDYSGFSTQAAFFDYDHDGDLDMYLLNHGGRMDDDAANIHFRFVPDSSATDRFYRNERIRGKNVFRDVSRETGIGLGTPAFGLGIAVADFNNDGWEDVYISNDFRGNDYYYLNNGRGKFAESGAAHFMHSSRYGKGNDAADFNNDGLVDLITLDILPPDERTQKMYGSAEAPDTPGLSQNGIQHQLSRNAIQRNNQRGTSFSDVALMGDGYATDWSWGALFADFDNDSKKDLFITSGIARRFHDLDFRQYLANLRQREDIGQTNRFDRGIIRAMPDGAGKPNFFRGDGRMGFKEVNTDWGSSRMNGYFTGAAYADLDNDGDLDVLLNALNQPAVLLENTASGTGYLAIHLKSDSRNSQGIGARAWLFAGGQVQMQTAMATRGFMSASQTTLHFGLGNAKPDSLLVVWPHQQFQWIKSPPAGALTVEQENAAGLFDYAKWFPQPEREWEYAGELAGWKHAENDFTDFQRQYLIPHAQSTRGPAFAVGDFNNDGLADFYAGGAKGQAGAVYRQWASGNFSYQSANFPVAQEDEVDAEVFDANGDGWNDLYVVTGGNEADSGAQQLRDRFYLNVRGRLVDSSSSIPSILTSKSCVAAADYDGDGDMDLFIGGLANAGAYGLPQDSYFLLNNGNGKFEIDQPRSAQVRQLGMVTDAQFADMNGDGLDDLVVVGEWMPVMLFINTRSGFELQELPASRGLWQSVLLADVNGDGRIDILAGNWGENSKRWAGKNGPLKLYVKDFDNNGTTDQVMAYTFKGEEFPFLAKDDLQRQLPSLKETYPTYSEVAGKTVQFMLHNLFHNYLELRAETLSSTAFVNETGGFAAIRLPDEFQLAPVMTIAALADSSSFLLGGNYFGTLAYEGRYDALMPGILKTSRDGVFSLGMPLAGMTGELRAAALIPARNGNQLLLLRNNQAVARWRLKNGHN